MVFTVEIWLGAKKKNLKVRHVRHRMKLLYCYQLKLELLMIFVDWLVFVASLNHSLLETLSVFILSILLSKCAFLVCLITLVVSLRICLNFDHAASVFVCLFV